MQHHQLSEKETPLKDLLQQYTRHWFWFVLAVIVAFIGARIYLRYSTPIYQSKATVIIKNEKNGGPEELSAFTELSFFSKFNNKIENELAIFRSKRIISKAITELSLNIRYESVGAIKTTEMYAYRPFVVQYQTFTDSLENHSVPRLFFEIKSEEKFQVEDETQSIVGSYNFGERIALPFGEITVLPNLDNLSKFKKHIGKTISVTHTSIEGVAIRYQQRLKVLNDVTNSNVVTISVPTTVREKAEDFINELIFQYNRDAINDQNQIAQKTANFIDSRIEIITKELDSVEQGKEDFKSENRLTDIEAEAQLVLNNASEFNKRQFDIGTQLELSNTMINYMEQASNNDLLPANIGLNSESTAQAVDNYNQLVLERNNLLKTATTINPVVERVNDQIEQVRSGLLQSLKNTRDGLKLAMQDLNYQESTLNTKIAGVPKKEKIFRDIERQQAIKEQLYIFLLQQREEASISLAVTAPKAKVVDPAYSSKKPVSPDVLIVYLAALLAGLLVPFLIIYVRNLLNTKIRDRKDIESTLRNIPIVGEIPKLKKGASQLIRQNDRSIMAESFRILRTNLQYILINKLKNPDESKTIFVTSTIKGEGKTFVAFNLALTIALTGKKVVLVGADIRNPQLQRYLPPAKRDMKGLTEFIIDDTLQASEISATSENNSNLDIVLSGAIPPNPAELLMQQRAAALFEQLAKEYDYIIVDTAPAMLVADTLLINKFADVTLYVARAGYSDKRLLEFPREAVEDERLRNVALVMNDVSLNNFGYGSKYGYAYSEEKKPWYQRAFNR